MGIRSSFKSLGSAVVFLGIVGFTVPVCAGPVLLGTIPIRGGLGGNDPVVDQRIEFTLQIEQTPGTLGTGIGSGVFWRDGDSGAVDFTQNNDLAFAEFASLVTNGIDEQLVFLAGLPGGVVEEEGARSPFGWGNRYTAQADHPTWLGTTSISFACLSKTSIFTVSSRNLESSPMCSSRSRMSSMVLRFLSRRRSRCLSWVV